MERTHFMFTKRLLLTVFLGASFFGGFGNAQSRCPMDSRNSNLATQFRIGGSSIQMPIGAFLLVRKNGQIGAIRLTNIDSTATEDYGKSSYESYVSSDASISFNAATVIRQTGELDVRPLKGPGRDLWIYQPGPHKARIGKWSFSFVTPDMMWMAPYHRSPSKDYEFAPTSACDVSEIDAHDKRLRWFRFDPNAKVILPLADLPK
jgi:hypothetical protein